ncbi:phospholipase A-2-activating protein isoform X2 [Solanum pennellii]|uniref:Phospholipase A-2-activating protein isoform X2 n=1 Tax=Solanum pennellii TaxID=28526 RepID=A0ABM1FVD5_SOLPN|nr:phospholipase A-2-activating protein isoform X2 [Solanum pennellii]
MEIDSAEYQLRCQLTGHEDDVRGICICDKVGFATSSRDRTIRFWSPDESNHRSFTTSKILLGHTSFVGPLAWVAPSEELPEGGLVSGGMDTLILVWNLSTGDKVQTLKGHKLQVTGIALDGSDVVSTSVDCTLRRWRKGQEVEVLEAHKAAIQAIIRLPSGELVTGSSDTTLKVWNGAACVHTFSGHTDTVRGLAAVPGLGVLSASHDGTIRLWELSGQVLLEMVGHTSIVYSVDAHASGLIVSGSEDRFAKIWKDGVCVQSLEHPGCVWDAKFLDNGDIVTACSDGVVRIWTVHQDKIADPLELESYAAQLSQYTLSRKRVGGLKLEELPGLEALQIPGTSDGQTKVVREGDNGVAYAWNMMEQKWDKIGEVVDGPNDGMSRPLLDGIQYDHVFDVDIGDGEPIRKLPCNRSDNPYDVADKWLLKENLPLSYREQIVEFILQNTGQKQFTPDPSFRDPYTGSSAYTPGQPSKPVAKPTFKHVPKKGMLVFDAAQFDGILKKVSEFNNTLLSAPEQKHMVLTEADMSRLASIIHVLKDTSHYHSSKFSDDDVVMVLKLLKSWPLTMLFPVIDILRMMILHADGAAVLSKHVNKGNDVLMELIKKVTTSPPLPANLLTSVRALTNFFKNASYHDWLLKHRGEVLDAYSTCYLSSNKNVQLAYSTLILNYAVLLVEKKDEEGQSQVLSAALEIAEEESVEADAKFRALVAIGSLMLEGVVKRIAMDFDVANIAKAAKASKDAKIAEVGADIELITKQS